MHFKKSLLLCVKKYSLYNLFLEILKEMSDDVDGFDIREKILPSHLKAQSQMFRFPYKIRNRWEKHLFLKINNAILKKIQTYKPDLVMVYNSEYLLPETCVEIKKKAKLIFFMGDSPFFSHTNDFYLPCLNYADLILSPDTFWISQLNTIGIHKTTFFVPGLDGNSYYLVSDQDSLHEIEESEVLYNGAGYNNSWGYKKALLMSQFTDVKLKLYGNSAWKRWFRFFPELKPYYIESDYIPTQKLNKMYNKTKIIPVDGNPAILNGFHLRLFEALGAGALPLVEYRMDVEELLFKDCPAKVPLIRDYSKAGDIAKYYLKNESERKELALTLRSFIISEYNAVINSERLLTLLKKNSVV